MSLETEIVFQLRSRLSQVGIRRIQASREVVLEGLRSAWLSSINQGPKVNLVGLANTLAKELHIQTKVVGNQPKNAPIGAIVISNHIGVAKLLKITRTQLQSTLPKSIRRDYLMTGTLQNSDSFLVLFAPPISAAVSAFKTTQIVPIPVSISYKGSFGTIADSLGFVQIGAARTFKYQSMYIAIRSKLLIARESGYFPVVIMFPEGGTTGKRQTNDPFVLEPFQSGFYHLSQDLELPIVPITVTYNSSFNFLAQVFLTSALNHTDPEKSIEQYHQDMQCSIDQALTAHA